MATKLMDDNLGQCPVCFIFFDDTEQRPRNLPCGHTFCTMCINQLKMRPRMMQTIVVCPTCRSRHNVPGTGNFPICYSLEAVIMSMRNVNVSGSKPSGPGKPTVYHTSDTGQKRNYIFRRIKTPVIQFKVKAKHDVAICLSPTNEAGSEGYEVLIGCWGGNMSGIRKRGTGIDLCKIHTPGILGGGADYQVLWIKITHKMIEVGKTGAKHAFMSYSDPSPIRHLSWYGYSTGWGAEGYWTFSDVPPLG